MERMRAAGRTISRDQVASAAHPPWTAYSPQAGERVNGEQRHRNQQWQRVAGGRRLLEKQMKDGVRCEGREGSTPSTTLVPPSHSDQAERCTATIDPASRNRLPHTQRNEYLMASTATRAIRLVHSITTPVKSSPA